MWKLGQLEIEQIIRNVCKEVLCDNLASKQVRRRRCDALKLVGAAFKAAGRKDQNLSA